MESMRQATARGVRKSEPLRLGEWVAHEVPGGYTAHCGDVVLHTVNTPKPRVFKTLDAVKRALAREMGVTEFKVETLKT